jgi:hypothetical protein
MLLCSGDIFGCHSFDASLVAILYLTIAWYSEPYYLFPPFCFLLLGMVSWVLPPPYKSERIEIFVAGSLGKSYFSFLPWFGAAPLCLRPSRPCATLSLPASCRQEVVAAGTLLPNPPPNLLTTSVASRDLELLTTTRSSPVRGRPSPSASLPPTHWRARRTPRSSSWHQPRWQAVAASSLPACSERLIWFHRPRSSLVESRLEIHLDTDWILLLLETTPCLHCITFQFSLPRLHSSD